MASSNRPTRLFVRAALLCLSAYILGTVFFAGNLRMLARTHSLQNGDWTTNTATGSPQASLHLKAYIALTGLLASQRTDSMYYQLNSAGGEPLKLNCDYLLHGTDMAADWWSITAYGKDHYLLPNSLGRYSYNNANVESDADGNFTIKLSSRPQVGNWIPVADSRAFDVTNASDYDLLLRLYTPGSAYLSDPGNAPVPRIEKLACR